MTRRRELSEVWEEEEDEDEEEEEADGVGKVEWAALGILYDGGNNAFGAVKSLEGACS